MSIKRPITISSNLSYKRNDMTRRRMIDPSFWEDSEVAQLTRDERLLLLGCLQHGDDDGRLKGNSAYLKASVFMYDRDIGLDETETLRDSMIKKMEGWRQDNLWRLALYANSGADYLAFPNWTQHQKPSHPTPSKLPPPPESIGSPSVSPHETERSHSRETPEELHPSLGQSSQVKDSIVEDSQVQALRAQFDDRLRKLNSTDLTDLTTFLTDALEVSATAAITVVMEFWRQAITPERKSATADVLPGARRAVARYPPEVIARALFKAKEYHAGTHQAWNYIEPILEEEARKGKPP